MKATAMISTRNHEGSVATDSPTLASSQCPGELQIRLQNLHGLICHLLQKNQQLRTALALAEKGLSSSASPLNALSQPFDTGVTNL